MVICLERGADLHMAQLMPLPLTVSCSSKIQIGFTFLVLAHPGSPGKRAVKRVCVCVCIVCYGAVYLRTRPETVLERIHRRGRQEELTIPLVRCATSLCNACWFISEHWSASTRHTWSLMNRFRTGQGPCHASLHKWGLAQSPSCCGQRQTMNHIVDTCPFTAFEGGLNLLHNVDDDAVIWLEYTAIAALTK